MSTPQNRLTPAPVRQDALCMCVHGSACSSFAPGHAVHLIQARLIAATPSEWVDAIATPGHDGALELHTLDGDRIHVWNGAGAAAHVAAGEPVAYHPRYHAVSVGARTFNVAVID